MNTNKDRTKRRPGPVPGPATKKYNVLVEEDIGEWAKQQPGGLSELVRRLLKEERKRHDKRT